MKKTENVYNALNYKNILGASLTAGFALMGLAGCSGSGDKAQTKAEEQPNVIFILADDLGAGDLAVTGHPYVKSPNIDQLASEGIMFERAYVAASWCSPTRYSLMTGMFPGRDFYDTYNLMPDEPSVTKLLHEAGYATAHIGKWHMNKGKEYSESPGDFGIDKHFTTSSNGPGWTREQRQEPYWRAKTSDRYVDMVIDFIEENKEKPFYVNLWVHPTHSYINPSPQQLSEYEGLEVDINDFESEYQREFLSFVAQYGDINEAMQAYCADVTGMDKAIGKLMQYLDETDLDQNTLVVFMSDNGPGPLTQQIENKSVVERYKKRPDLLNSVGSAKIHRDRKLSIHEGGVRTPYIVRWPGKVPAGRVNSETVVSSVDWLPTIATLCKLELPEKDYDGLNMSEAWLGKEIERNEPLFWLENNGQAAILDKNLKGVIIDDEFALYDVVEDPGEKTDLSQKRPDDAERTKEKLENWLETITKN
jgi:N-acetylgalactosamine-6-sulfatase